MLRDTEAFFRTDPSGGADSWMMKVKLPEWLAGRFPEEHHGKRPFGEPPEKPL
jgi:hypothetical protein